jgi:hypothetical protein
MKMLRRRITAMKPACDSNPKFFQKKRIVFAGNTELVDNREFFSFDMGDLA